MNFIREESVLEKEANEKEIVPKTRLSNKTKWLAAALIMILVTVGADAYAQAYGANEIVHFWIAVPAGDVTALMVMKGAGSPISLSPI